MTVTEDAPAAAPVVSQPTATTATPVAGGYAVTVTARAGGSRENQQPARILVWLNDYLVADLRGADVGGALFWTRLQLRAAVVDASTTLPVAG